jgi:hypothetical protein
VIALGVILILIAVAATVFAVIASGTISTAITLTGLGITISATPMALFIGGALSVFMFAVGFALVTRGTRRTAAKRRELKQLRKDQPSPAPGERTGGAADTTVKGRTADTAHSGGAESTDTRAGRSVDSTSTVTKTPSEDRDTEQRSGR